MWHISKPLQVWVDTPHISRRKRVSERRRHALDAAAQREPGVPVWAELLAACVSMRYMPSLSLSLSGFLFPCLHYAGEEKEGQGVPSSPVTQH